MTDAKELLAEADALAKAWTKDVYARRLPWHALERVAYGSFSTILGIVLNETFEAWTGIAIGDSCAMHFRDNALLHSFPLSHPTDFGNTPVLLATDSARNTTIANVFGHTRGTLQSGDRLLLATDGFAQYAMDIALNAPTGALEGVLDIFNDTEAAKAILGRMQASGDLKNDDVAAVLISIP